MAKAVGMGGVFFKARDAKALSQWYETHFGIGGRVSEDALTFDGPESTGMTVFAHFPTDTKYFGDGPQQSMLNFRVYDLDGLLAQLGAAGVRIDPRRRGPLRPVCLDLGSGGQPGRVLGAEDCGSLSWLSRLVLQPVGQFGMAAFAGKIRGRLPQIAAMQSMGAALDQHFHQVLPAGAGGRKKWCKAAHLGGVGIGAVGQQQPYRFRIPSQGERSVQRLVALRILGDGIDLRAVLQKHIHRLGRAESGGQVQRRPAITRKAVRGARIGGQDVFEPQRLPHRCGLENIQQNAMRASCDSR